MYKSLYSSIIPSRISSLDFCSVVDLMFTAAAISEVSLTAAGPLKNLVYFLATGLPSTPGSSMIRGLARICLNAGSTTPAFVKSFVNLFVATADLANLPESKSWKRLTISLRLERRSSALIHSIILAKVFLWATSVGNFLSFFQDSKASARYSS